MPQNCPVVKFSDMFSFFVTYSMSNEKVHMNAFFVFSL